MTLTGTTAEICIDKNEEEKDHNRYGTQRGGRIR